MSHDEVSEVLRKAVQAVVDVLPPGYRLAIGVVDHSGNCAFGLSPGLNEDDARGIFSAKGDVEQAFFNKIH